MTTETELKLPCRFQPGDKALMVVTITAAAFEKGTPDKVYYGVGWGDGDGASRVDSCDLLPMPNVGDVIATMGVMERALNCLLPETHGGRAAE